MSRTAVCMPRSSSTEQTTSMLLERMGSLLLVEDHDLLDRLGITEPDPQHEAVELGLRQGERALVLDRVLRGDDEERVGHRVGRAVDRRLALLHALEEADWVFGVARLISSARTTWAMIGPGRNSNSWFFWL